MDWPIVMERFWTGILDRPLVADHESKSTFVDAINDYMLSKGDQLGELIVQTYPTKVATTATLEGHLQVLERRFGIVPDLVCVDYADILASSRHYDQRRDELANVYEDLRGVAVKRNVPIWTASQTNRVAMGKAVISIEHMADSWDKAKIADYIVALCGDDDIKARGQLVLSLAKVRNNANPGAILCDIDFSRTMFADRGLLNDM